MPMIDPQVLEAWQGKRYVGYSASPIYASIAPADAQGRAVCRRQCDSSGGGSGGEDGRAAQITLFGADFAFPMNKTHAGWNDGDLGPQLGAARHWVLDGHGQRVKTQLNFRSYLCELERYIAGHPQVRFYNSSRAGAMIVGTTFQSGVRAMSQRLNLSSSMRSSVPALFRLGRDVEAALAMVDAVRSDAADRSMRRRRRFSSSGRSCSAECSPVRRRRTGWGWRIIWNMNWSSCWKRARCPI